MMKLEYFQFQFRGIELFLNLFGFLVESLFSHTENLSS